MDEAVVLEVVAYTWEGFQDFDAKWLKNRRLPNTGQFEELWSVDCSCGDNDLETSVDSDAWSRSATLGIFDSCSVKAVGSIKEYSCDLRAGQNVEVGSARVRIVIRSSGVGSSLIIRLDVKG